MMSKTPGFLVNTFGAIAFALFLNACSNDHNAATSVPSKTVIQIPWEALTVPNLNGLRAHVILDRDASAPINMILDTTAGTATVTIPGLTMQSHTIQIVYTYTDGNGTITLAQSAEHTVDLSSGSATFNVPANDYITATFDEDIDGLSNAIELAEGTNPRDSNCVMGHSLIGSCTI